jgi:hypothetical protein
MGRVQVLRGNTAKALASQKRAFKYLALLPRDERGALGVGNLYEEIGRRKLAERWYLKEYRLCGPEDLGTVLNLFRFYMRSKHGEKAKSLAPLVQRLLDREFRKPQYLGLGMQDSKFVTEIKRDLDAALELKSIG